MAFEVQSQSETQATVRVSVDPGSFKAALEREMHDLGQRVRMPGFRPGHVPKSVLAKRFEKRIDLYDGFVHLACAFIALNRLV